MINSIPDWLELSICGKVFILQDKTSSGWDTAKRCVFNYEKSRIKIPDCSI